MKDATFAWRFQTAAPLSLKQVKERLGKTWTVHDSDYRLDSMSGPITKAAWARIFEIGISQFIIHLTVEAEQDTDLDALVVEAKDKLFRDVLQFLDAREIEESVPEAPNDYMSGWPTE